jgi:23S rRNA (uracil1939-C5)-methyltransferase
VSYPLNDTQQISVISTQLMAYGGEAMSRLPDGRVAFIPYALPGEKLRIQIIEAKDRYARARLLEVLEPSPERINPPCAHFGVCGGCHYQHIPYEKQLAIKTEILADQLSRIGGLREIPMQTPVASSSPWNYRNHVQFHLTAQGKLGYLISRSNSVLEIRECLLPEDTINLVWPRIDIGADITIKRLSLRLGDDQEVLMVLESLHSEPPQVSLEELSLSAVHLSPAGALVMAGSDHLIMEVRGRRFYVSAGSFFQVNTFVAEKMVEHLLENLSPDSNKILLELYCGVGLFSAFLAPQVGRLVGIESSTSACQDFTINLDEFENVELYEATVEETLPHLKLNPDILLVDPPRSGLDRHVIDAILATRPAILAYVSCDPATLSRDSRRLVQAGYQLQRITPFDLFPQTYHIESISIWA